VAGNAANEKTGGGADHPVALAPVPLVTNNTHPDGALAAV